MAAVTIGGICYLVADRLRVPPLVVALAAGVILGQYLAHPLRREAQWLDAPGRTADGGAVPPERQDSLVVHVAPQCLPSPLMSVCLVIPLAVDRA